MISDPKTEPIPAPEPATPTVAAPAPMNLAAESMSFLTEVVVKALLACNKSRVLSRYKSELCSVKYCSSLHWFVTIYYIDFT